MKIVLKDQWGWVVTMTSFCNYFIAYGMIYSYGLLYIALQEEFNSNNTETGNWFSYIHLKFSNWFIFGAGA